MVKKAFAYLLATLLVFFSCCASAVEICKVEFPADSTYINLTGIRRMVNGQFQTSSATELNAAFAQMPNLKRVDMWDWPLRH